MINKSPRIFYEYRGTALHQQNLWHLQEAPLPQQVSALYKYNGRNRLEDSCKDLIYAHHEGLYYIYLHKSNSEKS